MLNKKLALALLLLSTQSFAQENQNTEKVILSLSAPESAQCADKIFNGHAFKLTVTQSVLENGSLDKSKSKIYEDGVLKGVCKENVKVISFNDYSKIFTNLGMIKELNDEETIQLFNKAFVGYCHLRYGSELEIFKNNNRSVALSREAFNTLLEETNVELESSDRRAVLAATLKNLVAQKKCGTFSKEIIQQTKESNLKSLAIANVGFDYLINAKTTKEEFLKAHYNAKKITKEFNLSIEELKKNQYTASELTLAGFESTALYKGGYPLAELLENDDAPKLKSLASIQEFVKAGADIGALKRIGFNEVQEIKTVFRINDFNTYYRDSWDSSKAAIQLKRLGYSAKEVKGVDHGISDLKAAGFDEINEIKPLYLITDFNAFYKDSWDSSKAAIQLKRLGYSIKEIKEVGHGISDLKEAKFDEINEIKPLYSIADFNAFYKDSWDSSKAAKQLKRLGYSAKEIKEVGHGISDLKEIGFDEIKDIKPLYSIADFNAFYKDSWDSSKSAKQLKRLGYTAKEIKEVGHGIADLKEIGFDETKDIKPLFAITDFNSFYRDSWDSSKAPKELKRLGYTLEQVKALGYNDDTLKAAGF